MKIGTLRVSIEPHGYSKAAKTLRVEVFADNHVAHTEQAFIEDDFESVFDHLIEAARVKIHSIIKEKKQYKAELAGGKPEPEKN